MAIDFLVMPISRYIPGAFITPTMQFAWSQGLPYTLLGKETRTIPEGEHFGGADAVQRREAYLASGILTADLAKYPAPICDELWDESSAAEPRFHRVDPRSYAALVEESRDAIVRRSKSVFFGILKRNASHRSHLGAQVFLPVTFEEPFVTSLVFDGWLAGSVQTALRELSGTEGSPESAIARETLRAALTDAAGLRFPLIVDQ